MEVNDHVSNFGKKKTIYVKNILKNCFQSLRRGHLPLFDWKCL